MMGFITKAISLAIASLLFASAALAQTTVCEDRSGDLKLEWDAVIDPSVVEIGVFVADVSEAQDLTLDPYATVPITAGQRFAYVDGDPLPDGDHYFVVTARNTVNTNSFPSNEVCATLIQGIPGTPQNLRIIVAFAWIDGEGVEGEIEVEINGAPVKMASFSGR